MNEGIWAVGGRYSGRLFRTAGIPAVRLRPVFRPHVKGGRYSGSPSAAGIPAAVKKNMATSKKNDERDNAKCGHTLPPAITPGGYGGLAWQTGWLMQVLGWCKYVPQRYDGHRRRNCQYPAPRGGGWLRPPLARSATVGN